MSIYFTNSSGGTNKSSFTTSGGTNQTYFSIAPATLNNLFADWSTRIGSTANYNQIFNVTSSPTGDVYVIGTYLAPLTLYNSSGTTFGTLNLTTTGQTDGMIVKYNTSGTAQWSAHIGPSMGLSTFGSGSVDPGGNVYVYGTFTSNPVTIYNSSGTSFGTKSIVGTQAGLLVKYNASGTVQWAAVQGSTDISTGDVVTTDLSNVFVGGGYNVDGCTIYHSNGVPFTTLGMPVNDTAGFLAKYNTSGTALWAGRVDTGGGGVIRIKAMAANPDGNVYVGGGYTITNAIVYPPNGGSTTTLTSSGNIDAMILKFSSNGATQWTTRLSNNVTMGNMTSFPSGELFITVAFLGTLSIYNASGSLYGTQTSDNSGDECLIKYNSLGVVQWSALVTGLDPIYGGGESGSAVKYDSTGNIYLTGTSDSDPVYIYNSNGTQFTSLANGGFAFGFVIVYDPSGMVKYATKITTPTGTFATGIAMDTSTSPNGVYVGGYYAGTPMTIYNSNGTTFGTMVNSGGTTYTNGFLIKY
jgi:hypothetical protein